MKRIIAAILMVLAAILLTGCDQSRVPVDYRWASVEGSTIDSPNAGEQFYFNIEFDEPLIQSGVPVRIKVSGKVDQGALRFELRQPDGNVVWDSGTVRGGDYTMNTEYAPTPGKTGVYTLGVVFEAGTKAVYNLSWTALKVGPSVLIGGLGMVLVAVAFTTYAARRKLGWKMIGLGALMWAITVALKFLFAIPVNPLVFKALNISYTDLGTPGNIVAYLYVGALTGIFEVGVTWLVLRYTRWGQASWGQALAFGIGFGAVEALLLGLMGLASQVAGLVAPDALPAYALGSLAQQATPLYGVAPVFERITVVFAHIFSCVLLFYAIARRQPVWLWVSIVYKSLLDAPGAFAQFWGVNTIARIWTIEGIIAIFALIAIWGIWQIRRCYPPAEVAAVV